MDGAQVLDAVKLNDAGVARQEGAGELGAFVAEVEAFVGAALSDLAAVVGGVGGDLGFAAGVEGGRGEDGEGGFEGRGVDSPFKPPVKPIDVHQVEGGLKGVPDLAGEPVASAAVGAAEGEVPFLLGFVVQGRFLL